MIKYLQKIMKKFLEKASLTRNNLFEIREEEDIKLLPEEKANQCHVL